MWKQAANKALGRTIGYHLERPPGHPAWRMASPTTNRLLTAPVFIFSAPRAGSTLLRALLGAHSRLYAPPELPLGQLQVSVQSHWIQTSMQALQLTEDELQYMLWDQVLASVLVRSRKPTIVVKTPSNVLRWQRIAECWPDARYVFLLRHPGATVASLHTSWSPEWHPSESGSFAGNVAKGLRYMSSVEEARSSLPGITVRYEELTTQPAANCRRLCEFLGLGFEPAMLDYAHGGGNRFVPGLGDASQKIRSGEVHPPAPLPPAADIPPDLAGICATWGYLDPGPGNTALPPPQDRAHGHQPGPVLEHPPPS